MLVHGAPDRGASFGAVVPHLADHRVVVYDRRGYGRSLDARPATGMVDHARDLLAILDGFDDPPVVVAHSFGSNPTMLAATLRPGAFGALGVWEPPMPWLDWWPTVVRELVTTIDDPEVLVERMYRGLLGDDGWDAWPPDVQARRRAEGPAFRADLASELDPPFAFADVAVPAVVGVGTATSDVHVRGARWVAEHLPDAHLHTIAGAGHFAHRTHPAAFAGFVRATASRAPSRTGVGGHPGE